MQALYVFSCSLGIKEKIGALESSHPGLHHTSYVALAILLKFLGPQSLHYKTGIL